MQYLLTKEEMDKVVPLQKLNDATDALLLARMLILDGHKQKCVHEKGGPSYCDDCAMAGLDEEHDRKKLICTLQRQFSK